MKGLYFKLLVLHCINLTLAMDPKSVYVEIWEDIFYKKQNNGKFNMCFPWIIFQECWVSLLEEIMSKTFDLSDLIIIAHFITNLYWYFKVTLKPSFQQLFHYPELSSHYLICKSSGLKLLQKPSIAWVPSIVQRNIKYVNTFHTSKYNCFSNVDSYN